MSDAVLYVCIVRLNGADRSFFWESGGDAPDRVLLDAAGSIRAFPSEIAAREAAQSDNQYVSADAPSVYDLDAIETWCHSTAEILDSTPLLNAWNLFVDLPRGESLFAAADVRANLIYDKLFFSCNLPAITPADEHYVARWTASETEGLKRLLLLGLAELKARL